MHRQVPPAALLTAAVVCDSSGCSESQSRFVPCQSPANLSSSAGTLIAFSPLSAVYQEAGGNAAKECLLLHSILQNCQQVRILFSSIFSGNKLSVWEAIFALRLCASFLERSVKPPRRAVYRPDFFDMLKKSIGILNTQAGFLDKFFTANQI